MVAKTKKLTRRELEDFIMKQFEEYVRLHKEHEKDLSYIG